MLWSAVEFSHNVIRAYLADAPVAFDATVGNGGDTMFLLEVLGGKGIVIGTDVQQVALENTQRAVEQGQYTNYQLFNRSFVDVLDILNELELTHIDIAMFNCGYLPSGNKTITTKADETVLAVSHCMKVLAVGGVVSIVLYVGHPEGVIEANAMREFVATLQNTNFQVCRYTTENMKDSPECIIIQRLR